MQAKTNNPRQGVPEVSYDDLHFPCRRSQNWTEYREHASDKERSPFFNPSAAHSQQMMHAHFDMTENIVFEFNKGIVDVIVGGVMLHPDGVNWILYRRALGLLHGVNNGREKTRYSSEVVATVKKHRKFNLLVKFITCGASFQQAAQQINL
jgi:hypothetical protein